MNRDTTIGGFSITAAVLGGLILLTLIVFIGWQVGWWFTIQNAKRQGQLNTLTTKQIVHSQAYQANLQSEVQAEFQQVLTITAQQIPYANGTEVGALKAQRYEEVNSLCANAVQADPGTLSADQQSFVNANCMEGTVNPASIYAKH
jgi:hypothetical protein